VDLVAAIDLTPAGDLVVDRAASWAKAHGATLVLLHVVHDPELAPAFGSDAPGDVIRAKEKLTAVAAALGVPCRVDVRTAEDIAATIVEAGRNAAYLFVGSQGKSGFQRLRLGSVATTVLKQSKVPVVCVPPTQG
jgi:universal stress protein A